MGRAGGEARKMKRRIAWSLLLTAALSAPGVTLAQARKCDGLIPQALARALAEEWIAAWNSHKAAPVMALYADDFEMRSPGIVTAARGDPSGVLKGQARNRERWFGDGEGDQTRLFKLIEVFAGVRSITILYENRAGQRVTEVEEYRSDCKAERSNALYGPALTPK